MKYDKSKLNDRWLEARNLFQDRDNTIRSGNGKFWGRSDSSGRVSNSSGSYAGRVNNRGGLKR